MFQTPINLIIIHYHKQLTKNISKGNKKIKNNFFCVSKGKCISLSKRLLLDKIERHADKIQKVFLDLFIRVIRV